MVIVLPSHEILLYFLFIFYLSRCTLPEFLSVSSHASLPFLSCCYRTTRTIVLHDIRIFILGPNTQKYHSSMMNLTPNASWRHISMCCKIIWRMVPDFAIPLWIVLSIWALNIIFKYYRSSLTIFWNIMKKRYRNKVL